MPFLHPTQPGQHIRCALCPADADHRGLYRTTHGLVKGWLCHECASNPEVREQVMRSLPWAVCEEEPRARAANSSP